jgi:hypothetical protein
MMSEIDQASEGETVLEIIDDMEQAEAILLLPEASILLDEALLHALLRVGGLREIPSLEVS